MKHNSTISCDTRYVKKNKAYYYQQMNYNNNNTNNTSNIINFVIYSCNY